MSRQHDPSERSKAFYQVAAPFIIEDYRTLVEFCAGDGKGGKEFDRLGLDKIVFVVLDIQGFMRKIVGREAVKIPIDLLFLGNVDILKMSRNEFNILFPNLRLDAGLNRLRQMGVKVILITAWNEVICCARRKYIVYGNKRSFQRTIGAGDTFLAYFYAEFIRTKNIKQVLRYAQSKTYMKLSIINELKSRV